MAIESRVCACGCGRSKMMTAKGKYYSQSCVNRAYLKRKKEWQMEKLSEIESIKKWFEQAIPNPTIETACVQIGCAFEETSELARTIGDNEAMFTLEVSSNFYKGKNSYAMADIESADRVQLLDDLVDEIVTRIGIAHNLRMDIIGALAEVNRSNYSKFEEGKPVFDANGKITKGKNYTPPDLSKFI